MSESTDTNRSCVVLELRLRNHPGALSHVTGLFARRGYNLEAILCVPQEGDASVTLLRVARNEKLRVIEQQLRRLYDVLDLRVRKDFSAEECARLCAGFWPEKCTVNA